MDFSLSQQLNSGRSLIGTLITLASLESAEILSSAGFDWLFLDLEHSALDIAAAQGILQVVAGRVPCLLRVPLNDEIWIKKALDTGADGVIVPQVNTAEAAARAVRFSKYPLRGGRSVGVSRAHGYGEGFEPYIARADRETCVVTQVEHIEAVRNIEQILAVEGLNAVFIGPYDLSASMGLMGQVESPPVLEAIDTVWEACRAHGMPLGIFTLSPARAKTHLAEGYALVACGSDTSLLSQSARRLAGDLSASVSQKEKTR